MSLPILSLCTFVPLLGALAILLMPSASNARWIALITTILTFALSLLMWANFNPANPGFQLVEKYNWLGGGISYHMGVDGISMLFVVLTAGLMPFCIAASWEQMPVNEAAGHNVLLPHREVATYARLVKRWIKKSVEVSPKQEEMRGSLYLIASERKCCGELVSKKPVELLAGLAHESGVVR